MNSYQFTAQKMAKIQIQTVHLRGGAKKAGLRLGKIGGTAIFQEPRDGFPFKVALGGCLATSGLQRGKAKQPADKPDRPVARRLPGRPAAAPFVAQSRQGSFIKSRLCQQ